MRPADGPAVKRVYALRHANGFGLVEIVVTLVVVALLGALAYNYFASTAKTLETIREERPLSQARLAADRATATSIRSSLQMYYAQHGQWPPSKEAVSALMSPPPAFQCTGNDYTYDPGTGEVRLLTEDPARC